MANKGYEGEIELLSDPCHPAASTKCLQNCNRCIQHMNQEIPDKEISSALKKLFSIQFNSFFILFLSKSNWILDIFLHWFYFNSCESIFISSFIYLTNNDVYFLVFFTYYLFFTYLINQFLFTIFYLFNKPFFVYNFFYLYNKSIFIYRL